VTDAEKERLLELLAKFLKDNPDLLIASSVADFAAEVAMSMNVTTNTADACRFYIESEFS
jgi:hypothetical protein